MKTLRAWLTTLGSLVVGVAWLAAAMAITFGLFGLEVKRGNMWVVMLVFAVPIVAILLGGDVRHRITKGPQAPGRHARHDR
jgi:hypothetical protein